VERSWPSLTKVGPQALQIGRELLGKRLLAQRGDRFAVGQRVGEAGVLDQVGAPILD
jgi:hypothetical protein